MHVVVIGAGVAGVTTAWYLRRSGAEVTVLDRARGPGLETSFANGALLHPSLAEPWNGPGILWQILRWLGREDSPMLLRPRQLPALLGWGVHFIRNSRPARFRSNAHKNLALALYSCELMRELREEIRIEYAQRFSGMLALFRSRTAFEKGYSASQALIGGGVPATPLERDAVVALEPALVPIASELFGGIHFTRDEGGDAHRFCAQLAREAEARGVRFRFGVPVGPLESRGRRVVAAHCGTESFPADAFVLAAGSYSPLLVCKLALDLPVRPVKGYSITMPRAPAAEAAPRMPTIDLELHAVVVPVGEDRIRVAGTAELAGYDLSISPKRIANLMALLARIYPRFAASVAPRDMQAWAGLRPTCPDGVPLIGATPIENLFLNTGHGHLGWTLAAGSGRLAADIVLGRRPTVDAHPYRLDRF